MPLGFEGGPWLTLALGAFVLGHLAVLLYFFRASARDPGGSIGAPPAEPRPNAEGEVVRSTRGDPNAPGDLPPVQSERVVHCPHCGVENAAEFRFCRFCVGELSDGTAVADPAGASRDGQAF